MTRISMKQLFYFEALARHLHFGHAAEVCNISQPALSIQIKELEAQLGVSLVERSSKNIRLTPFGEDIAARARAILQEVEALEASARTARRPFHGRIRIGVIPTVAPYYLPRFIAHLTRRFPDLEPQLREAMTGSLIDDLNQGRLDVAIVALPISEPTLHERALFEEEFVLVRPANEEGSPVPDVSQLREMRLLLLEEGHCFRDQALSFCGLAPTKARDIMEGSSLSTLVQMVGAGIGVTLIPEMAVSIDGAASPVSISRLASPAPKRTIGMVWRHTNPLAPQLETIATTIEQEME
ncbi:hydrogen peroxide-inducible genes activator [Halocynthiibacter sp. C4]|uniref:hydrogen peroxide-inducible genes activator n=1 Tax=Halocynthiibacter sp. C4 TaxID=2992758 RepID=UPI00237BF678|nr:hydrogen peroxide-inducible genes activator [Halocynthiibacter sp. C4]MDE0589366.1 hydrogen peroxide-inducible genes activator [Halocynthiibacter sp. C4]